MSTKIFAGLQHINMTNSSGWVVQDPRYTKQPWASQLAELVPELNNLDSTITSNAGQVRSLHDMSLPSLCVLFKPQPDGVLATPSCTSISPACFPPTQVWELMNVAYAEHEIISDYVTAALMWFESGWVAASGLLLKPALSCMAR